MNATPAKQSNRSLIEHVLTTLMSKVWVFTLGLVLAALRGRYLGPELLAAMLLALTLPNFLLSLFNMGVATSNVYFIGRGEITPARALRSSLRMGVGLSVLGTLSGALTIWLGAEALYPGVGADLLWGALVVFPILLIRSYVMSLLHADEDFRWFNGILSCEAVCVLLITAVAFLGFEGEALSAIVAFGIAAFIGLCLCVIPVRRHLRRMESRANAKLEANATNSSYSWRCLNYGWKANLANLLAFLNHRVDLLLINLFVTPVAAGIYAGATMVTERIWILSQSVSTVILPRLSRLETDDPSRSRLTRLVSNIVFLSTLGLSLVLAFAGEMILGLLLGPKFVSGASVLVWLLPGTVLASFARVLTNDLAARGLVGSNVWNAAVLVLVNIVANLLLIPKYGIVGAAWSSSLGWTAYTILTLRVYGRHNSTVWWELLLPRQQDVPSLVRMIAANLRGNVENVSMSSLRGIRFLRRGFSLMLICGGGVYLTSLVEYRQSELIVPLRNLWQYGETSSRSGELLATSRYKHGEGTNPVHVAQTVRNSALAVIDGVEASKLPMLSAVERKRLFQVADYFAASGERRTVEQEFTTKDNSSFRVWAYDFDYPTYGLKHPWYSGMAQGHVIEVELAAYFLSLDRRYFETACEAARSLGVPIARGGVAVNLARDEGIWFEEYASTSTEPPLVLNGHNFALNGLWHLSRIEPEFVPLFEAGVQAVREKLPEFDAGVWSRYDLHHAAANQKYQMIHIDQLRELYIRTGESRFDEYANIFTGQLRSPLQICYRLCVYPHRMLVLLIAFNSCSVALMSKCIQSIVGHMRHRCRLSASSSVRALSLSSPAAPLERAA